VYGTTDTDVSAPWKACLFGLRVGTEPFERVVLFACGMGADRMAAARALVDELERFVWDLADGWDAMEENGIVRRTFLELGNSVSSVADSC
jgi:rhodanese-related sulfurtransferase